MRKRGRRLIWPRLFILLVLVAASLAIYFILLERKHEEKELVEERSSVREVVPSENEPVPQIALETPMEKEPTLTQEVMEKRPRANEDYCSKIENSVQDFFMYLNKENYVQHLETGTDTYDRFKGVIMKLSSHPPIPAGEGIDTITMTRNIYHFYRVLDRNDLRLIKEIMRNEADSLEMNLDMFFKWLMLGERCPDLEGTRPSLDLLYQYAGFFLNTIGGRAYLFRRPLHIRLLVSYYSLLIIHEVDKRGKNTYGIDIFPEITPLATEMSIYPDFHLQNEYIHQLTELQNYYLGKR